MIPIAEENRVTGEFAARRIDMTLDSKTAMLWKRIRRGLDIAGAFNGSNRPDNPSHAMAFKALLELVEKIATVVTVGDNGQPVFKEQNVTQQSRPVCNRPRIPGVKK